VNLKKSSTWGGGANQEKSNKKSNKKSGQIRIIYVREA